MKLAELLKLYSTSDQTKRIVQTLKSQASSRLYLSGLTGSAPAFIASGVIQQTASKELNIHLFILPEKEEGIYFFNDLENLIGKEKVLFFPCPYRKPYEVEETDNANILLRAEALNEIRNLQLKKSPDSIAIVTYPEALSEKVVTKKQLEKNTLTMKINEQLSLEFIMDVLFEYGFERVDYVIEPGQFSIRGGIIDIFSFANDQPYRVELSGDEVASIRSFDPVSQLSTRQHQQVNIVPNVQSKLMLEERESFLQYLPDNTTIWLKNTASVFDCIEKEYETASLAFSKLESLIDRLPPKELFITRELFTAQILGFNTIEFGFSSALKANHVIEYHFSPQPGFNKNFNLLIEHLQENEKAGIQNLIFSDTVKQIERLQNIVESIAPDKNTHHFLPVSHAIHEGFIDRDLKLACYTDHQLFERYHRFQLKNSGYKKKEALTLKELKGLQPGDYITHIDHGIGRYAGLEKIEVNGKSQEAIRLVYKDNDVLYNSIHSLHRIAKYTGKEGAPPKIDKLGSNAWANLKQKTKRKVKEIAFDLIKLYAERKSKKGFAFSPDNYLQNELEASFIYEDTPDQLKATMDVKRDMEADFPMDRLVCGDVGFGKTEIAIRAAFKAVCDSKQVVVLVPTTILALQHYKTFSERMSALPCTVDYLNRFKSVKQQNETIKKLAEGKIDIIIGTHRIIGNDVKFKDLGLLIIDEEQKFGVAIKEKLKTIKVNVDSLTLTATPIPRTLQFSMMGARDLSIINTPPPNRYPVQTEVHTWNEEIIRDAILFEVQRGGQIFFVHNRVQGLVEIEAMLKRLCPNVKAISAHGQMDGDQLEKAMLDFVNGDYDVLISTTIVESGLDIANANTIIINDAHIFGLSDLHQLRGRVGRSNKKAFCYLIAPPGSVLTQEARKRLNAIAEFSELGSGFNIAMRDLDIRGAGNLLGAEQSGFITEIGYEMYQKILDEAMMELREEMQNSPTTIPAPPDESPKNTPTATTPPVQRFVKDCVIDTDLELLIPDEYVNNITERLSLYRELDETKTEEQLQAFAMRLQDRFGPVPTPTTELINTIRLRWLAVQIGFEKLVLKNNRMVGYFTQKQDSLYYQSEAFTRVLKFVQQHPSVCKMKENNQKLSLSFENIKEISPAIAMLQRINGD